MKTTAYLLFILILLGFGANGCGTKKVSAEGADTSLIDTNQSQELFVWVENARLHKEASLTAEVITEIKGGEKVILTGKFSPQKIKVKLRGVEFEDVWAQVRTSDGNEGWIFKGMLTEDEAKAKDMNDFIILPGKSIGKVKLGDKKEDVEKIYGASFIKEGDIFFTEGMSAKGFYVFKGSPLELQCVPNEKTGAIENILIREPASNWVTAEGIKMGTPLDELVKMNGKPISFTGFGWDYGGNVFSYNKGKLAAYESSMGINLAEPDNIDGLEEFMGDVDCTTANKKILGKGVKVAEISIFSAPAI